MQNAASPEPAPGTGARGPSLVAVETHYTEAGMDYRAWSRRFNMHFGYFRWPANPFALEPMLEEMSRQVFRRLDLAPGIKVLDLGCGLGAPARTLVADHAVDLTAVTIVDWQIAKARALTEEQRTTPRGRVEWKLGDFTGLDLPGASYQAAFSIEAACHAPGASKEPFVRECSRLLQPGAKLVPADAFSKLAAPPRWYAARLAYRTRSWAVARFADFAAFPAALDRHGFDLVAAEDISWRIAPSVMHVPTVTLAFLAGELLVRRRW